MKANDVGFKLQTQFFGAQGLQRPHLAIARVVDEGVQGQAFNGLRGGLDGGRVSHVQPDFSQVVTVFYVCQRI
jgi:hypothetical protein